MHAMFLTVNQFAQCIKHEWKECSTFSPPATVILLLFLTFEALLFAVFTLIMLGTQMNAIWNDETVCVCRNTAFLNHIGNIDHNFLFTCSLTGYRTVEEGGSPMGSQIEMEKYSGSLWTFLDWMVFTVHETDY